MTIVGDRMYTELPGDRKYQLPPLILRLRIQRELFHGIVGQASRVVEEEELIPGLRTPAQPNDEMFEGRKLDMAINLVEQYRGFLDEWAWGDCVLNWIRQCESRFEQTQELKNLMRPDVWPHAGRSSFVTLLNDKHLEEKVPLDRAVGTRLTFRQPPTIDVISEQFLLYLKSTVAREAYRTWSEMNSGHPASLPPERFEVNVIHMDL